MSNQTFNIILIKYYDFHCIFSSTFINLCKSIFLYGNIHIKHKLYVSYHKIYNFNIIYNL